MKIDIPSIDETPLTFGKYSGRRPVSVAKRDPGYIIWLWENVKPSIVSKALVQECEDALNEDDDRYDELDFTGDQ